MISLRSNDIVQCSPIYVRNATATASNPDKLDGRPSSGRFFPVNIVPTASQAIGTIQNASVTRCGGVLLRHTLALYARPDERCHPVGRRLRAKEQSAHTQNSQGLRECSPPPALQRTHGRPLRSPTQSIRRECSARRSSTSSIPE